MPILTHDLIKITNANGILGKDGLLTGSGQGRKLFGGHAIQSITIGRHTPSNPVQAVGKLGIVDYTSGIVTSDVAVDCVIVEGCSKADLVSKDNSVYKYARQAVNLLAESYVLSSVSINLQAGSPGTINLNYLCSGLASYLDVQDQPEPSTGEESDYAVVLGDDGSGIALVCDWQSGTNPINSYVPYINSLGQLVTGGVNGLADSGLPGGVQNISMNATINRDQVLDVRSASPMQFVTTYPLDFSASMEVYVLPVASGVVVPGASGYNPDTFRSSGGHLMRKLANVAIKAKNWNKHRTLTPPDVLTPPDDGDAYCQIIGLMLRDESEAISVGRYMAYTFQFGAADIVLPLPTL